MLFQMLQLQVFSGKKQQEGNPRLFGNSRSIALARPKEVCLGADHVGCCGKQSCQFLHLPWICGINI